MTFEEFVLSNFEHDTQMTGPATHLPRIAFALHLHVVAGGHAGRHFHFQGFLTAHGAGTTAVVAGVGDFAPLPLAIGTDRFGHHLAQQGLPNLPHPPLPVTSGAGYRPTARSGPTAAAGFAGNLFIYLELFTDTLGGFPQGQLKCDLQITTTPTPTATATATAATTTEDITHAATHAEVAQETFQGIVHIDVEAAPVALAPEPTTLGRVTELIVLGPLLGILQDLIGLGGFPEFLRRRRIIRILIRMMLDGQLTVRPLDVTFGCAPVDTQHFIVIAFLTH